MLSESTATKIIMCLILLFIICVIVLVVIDKRKNKRDDVKPSEKWGNQIADEDFEQDCVMDKMRVSVVDQFCRVEMVGIRSPKSVEIFTVVFETDEGEVIKFDMPKEMYDGIDVGQRGILTIANGELYSFELI